MARTDEIYACPMHPDETSDRPEDCPKCHMTMVKKSTHNHRLEYNHAAHSPNMFKQKFFVALLLTIPTLVFSHTVQSWFGWRVAAGSEYISAVFGVVLFFYGGTVFLKTGWSEIRSRRPGMMALIAMAIVVAFAYSTLVTLKIVDGMDFWWELASLITIMLLGHWLEMSSVMRASNAVNELAKLVPATVEIEYGDMMHNMQVKDVELGMIALVRPGANVPIDGVVVAGESSVDESMMTGESRPVAKKAGAVVVAGTTNGNGSLRVKITKIGDDTAISKIIKLVRDAEQRKSRTQVLADRAAGYLFYIAVVVAIITVVCWSFVGASTSDILQRVVTVLIVACPHAMGLAVPLVVSISTGLATRQGIVIRDRRDFEKARLATVVLFDKTGTLTTGKQTVLAVNGDVLQLAAAVEKDSEHSIAAAIRRAADKEKLSINSPTDFRAMPGLGVQATVDGRRISVGGENMLGKLETDAPKSKSDNTIVYVLENEKIIGTIEIGDEIRETSRLTIEMLRRRGISTAMVTGDSRDVAEKIAKNLGIDNVHAGILPDKKSAIVADYQRRGETVMFVGDGVNDAPALAQADVGVAVGAGADVAIESAGILLAGNDPLAVVGVLKLSTATYRKMIQNLVWGAGYNVVALPIAAGVLAPIGFSLSPTFGAIAMSCSTIIVAINAQCLRRTFRNK